MKKKSLSLLTLVCALCLALFACRKEIGQLVNADTPNVSASKLEAAKIFNAKFIAQHISENAKIPGFVILAPQWDQAWTVKNATGGTEYIAVPTVENHVDQLNTAIRRVFLFEINGSNVLNAQIVEFIGLNYNLDNNLDFLIQNNNGRSISGFNGAIVHYDLSYHWTGGNVYEDGKIKYVNASLTKGINEKSRKRSIFLSVPHINEFGVFETKEYKFLCTLSGQLRVAGNSSGGNSNGGGTGVASGMGGELSEVVIVGTPGGGTNTGGNGGYGGNGGSNTGGTGNEGGSGASTTITFGPSKPYLCGGVSATKTGNAYSGGVNNLGFIMTITTTGEAPIEILAIWPNTCFSIPSYNLGSGTAAQVMATTVFMTAYNAAMEAVANEVKLGIIPKTQIAVQAALQAQILAFLNAAQMGSTFSTGPCLGITASTARYC